MRNSNGHDQPQSVTHLVGLHTQTYSQVTQDKIDAAQKRGIQEHTHFERQVAYYYSNKQEYPSTLATMFPVICLALLFLVITIIIFCVN